MNEVIFLTAEASYNIQAQDADHILRILSNSWHLVVSIIFLFQDKVFIQPLAYLVT